MDGNYSSLEASLWYSLSEDEEIIGDDRGDAENDAVEVAKRRCLSYQETVLNRICGGSSNADEGAEPNGNNNRGGGEKDWILDLSDIVLLRCPAFFCRAFGVDLLGCLRRYYSIRIGRSSKEGGSQNLMSSMIRHVRFSRDSLKKFFRGGIHRDGNLQKLFRRCIGNLPDVESLRADHVSYRFLRPILGRLRRAKYRREDNHHLELRLRGLLFDRDEDLCHFADRHLAKRWDHLKFLELHDARVRHTSSRTACLDPIIRAIIGEGKEHGRGDDHLPRLETFLFRLKLTGGYRLDDDEAFIRLLNKPSIKHLALCGFVNPRHYQLIRDHLSKRPGIEILSLCASDLAGHRNANQITPEEAGVIDGAVRCLVRLVQANQNVRSIRLGKFFMAAVARHQGPLRSSLQELVVWMRLNRRGLGQFLVGDFDRSTSSWTRRQCVDFLAGLHQLFKSDSLTVEALFVTIRMRPDLLHRV